MKTFKFSLVLCTRENTDVFISLDDNIYGIHSKSINILHLFSKHIWIRQLNFINNPVFIKKCTANELLARVKLASESVSAFVVRYLYVSRILNCKFD